MSNKVSKAKAQQVCQSVAKAFGATEDWKPIKPIQGVWTEPYFSCVLCLYPA